MIVVYGNYNQVVLDYIRSKGVFLELAIELKMEKIRVDGLALPRLDCNEK